MSHISGDTRVVTRFLILPLKVNGEWRWLERVKIHQSYSIISKGWNNDWFIDEKEED